ncbi:MAG: BspA family leucine-rich repeat surface protein, partial [Promethearchaeota archaeon]
MKKLRASKAVYFILLTTLVVAIQIGILDWNLENYFLNLEENTEVMDYSLPFLPQASNPNAFISRWDTTKWGSSGNNQIKLPLTASGEYNFFVDWGDGTNDTITVYNQTEVTHTFPSSGIYTVNITGTIVGWKFGGDSEKIIEIQQWGCLRLGNTGNYFAYCYNLVISATDNLDLTGTTTLRSAFQYCYDLGSSGNMNGWDTSNITDMSYMFNLATDFNQPIGNWNVSKVTSMAYMFHYASDFNQPIGNWNVSKVTSMTYMFYSASDFNQSIGNWNVSKVTSMTYMFAYTHEFNQPLENWDVSKVTSMAYMFYYASDFNQSIGNWDVSSVTNMQYMFAYTHEFNQPLENWDVSSVTNMYGMFYYTYEFNQPLENWDVSSVTNMQHL